MEIVKIANLSKEEVDQLIAAGNVLTSLDKDAASYDKLSEGTTTLLTALKEVLEKILNK